MWTIKNNIIPFKGFKAITIFPFVFVRKDAKYTTVDARHECIHGKQQVEMLVLPFLLWYLIEWAIKSIKKGKSAYHDISFEREAYTNEKDVTYLSNRSWYAWINYL